MSAPLPIRRPSRHASRPMLGLWRAVMERADPPFAVSIPALYGAGRVIPNVEVTWEVWNVGPLAVGDRVWVTCVDGDSSQLVVTGRRW